MITEIINGGLTAFYGWKRVHGDVDIISEQANFNPPTDTYNITVKYVDGNGEQKEIAFI